MRTGVAEKIKTTEKELVRLAKRRVQLPDEWIELKYIHESDLLSVKYSRRPAVRSSDDALKGLVYNYDARGKLTSIEIIDLYDVFASV